MNADNIFTWSLLECIKSLYLILVKDQIGVKVLKGIVNWNLL